MPDGALMLAVRELRSVSVIFSDTSVAVPTFSWDVLMESSPSSRMRQKYMFVIHIFTTTTNIYDPVIKNKHLLCGCNPSSVAESNVVRGKVRVRQKEGGNRYFLFLKTLRKWLLLLEALQMWLNSPGVKAHAHT